MNNAKLVILAMTVSLAGCAYQYLPYPRATVAPASEQRKLQSAAHWDVLASNESRHIFRSLPNYATLHVAPQEAVNTPFNEAYEQLLVSNLVKQGATVMLEPADALFRVEYSIQTIRHHRREPQRLFPGTATAFWVGAKVLDSASSWSRPEMALLPLTLGADAWLALSQYTDEEATEVIITTRVHNNTRVVVADSRVYYFNPQDSHHYSEGRSFPVVGATGL